MSPAVRGPSPTAFKLPRRPRALPIFVGQFFQVSMISLRLLDLYLRD